MAWADIREQVAAILASVEGVGVVHRYQRLAKSWDRFLDLFKHENANGGQEINGWTITRVKRLSVQSEFGEGNVHVEHTAKLRGYLGLNDEAATELDLQDTVDRIAAAFKTNNMLNGAALDCEHIEADVIEPRMFGTVLCNFAELTLVVTEADE